MNEKTNQSITVPCRETGSNNILERFRLLLIKLSLFFFSSNICFGNLNLLPCRRSKGKKNTIQLVTRPSTDKIIQNSRISLETGRFPDVKKTIKRYLFDSSKPNFGTKRVQLKISDLRLTGL